MKPSIRLGLVGLLALMTSCTSAPSREAASLPTEAAGTTQREVTEASAGSSLPSSLDSDTPVPSADVRVVTAASCAFEYDPSASAERTWAFAVMCRQALERHRLTLSGGFEPEHVTEEPGHRLRMGRPHPEVADSQDSHGGTLASPDPPIGKLWRLNRRVTSKADGR